MARAGLLGALAAVLVACSLAAGPSTPAPPPSEADALGYLARVVATVQAGELDELCALGVSTCDRVLDAAARRSAPLVPPRVVASTEVPPAIHADGSWSSGGRLLTLCGLDRNGRQYVSELLVFEEDGRLLGVQPVFWTGLSVGLTKPGVTDVDPPRQCPG